MISTNNLSSLDLQGKTAIVTGGSRGIGRCIVKKLSKAGMKVIFTYLSDEKSSDSLINDNPECDIKKVKLDVRNSREVNSFVEKTMEGLDSIDVLVNNAGVIKDNLLALLKDSDINDVFDTNINGTFNFCRAIMPFMMSQRSGRIINISSISGDKGGKGQTNYAASKGAINAFTKSLAVEAGRCKILVNAVAPGIIKTDMSKDVIKLANKEILDKIVLSRYGNPEDIANVVWFLCSKLSSYITGQIINVDGGFKL